MKYLVFYEPADNVLERGAPHMDAHSARIREFHARGDLLLVGTLENPQVNGSLSVFRTREAAEEFVSGDPFVRHGVVKNWYVRKWNEVLAP
ncbi:YciI family protein [Amycolatopsis methanolica]|uniref:YciI family protein n=1 Tax=Amycolatopsis methanolica TaxID=1814 RepID=UPI00343776F3